MKKRVIKKKYNPILTTEHLRKLNELYNQLKAEGKEEYYKKHKAKTEKDKAYQLLLILGPEKYIAMSSVLMEHNVESISVDELYEALKIMEAEEEKTKQLLDKISGLEKNKG